MVISFCSLWTYKRHYALICCHHYFILEFILAVSSWVWVSRYDRRSVGQSVLEYSTLLGLATRFLLLSDSCGFVDVRHSLWRQDGSVAYNCSWSSPAQSFSGPTPVGLVTIFYCLRFETSFPSPPATRRVTVEVFEPAATRELYIPKWPHY
jgi:hypothetical protein